MSSADKKVKPFSAPEIDSFIREHESGNNGSGLARVARTLRQMRDRQERYEAKLQVCSDLAQGRVPAPRPHQPNWSDAVAHIVKLRGQLARFRAIALEHGCDPKRLELEVASGEGAPRG